jgi:hypothetical protein
MKRAQVELKRVMPARRRHCIPADQADPSPGGQQSRHLAPADGTAANHHGETTGEVEYDGIA